MPTPNNFIAFCEQLGGKPLTPQQRLLATTSAESAQKRIVFAPTPRTGRRFISEMWATYVRGHKADLLVTDEVQPDEDTHDRRR